MEYKEEDFLQISGLMHFVVCRRRWALIHVEQQWAENFLTADGALFHKNAHDAAFSESRGDRVIKRAVRVHSAYLGVSGECDVLEFRRGENGIPLEKKEGLWQPCPIEYKHGRPSDYTEADALQLCAQAMCLEEMLCCDIPEGALYYGEIRRRQTVALTPELREQVREMLCEMHAFYRRGYTPKVRMSKACSACSLRELCLPKLMKTMSAAEYICRHFREEETL